MNRLRSFKIVLALGFLVFFGLFPQPTFAQDSLPKLVKTIQPAVVTVLAYDSKGKLKGQGSGFFINQEGHFITNYHVLDEASRAEVKTLHGWRHSVRGVLAENRTIDLILVAIYPGELQMAIKLQPDYILPHYVLGQVYLHMDNKSAALE